MAQRKRPSTRANGKLVRLTDQLFELIKNIARREDRPMAVIIRRAILKYDQTDPGPVESKRKAFTLEDAERLVREATRGAKLAKRAAIGAGLVVRGPLTQGEALALNDADPANVTIQTTEHESKRASFWESREKLKGSK